MYIYITTKNKERIQVLKSISYNGNGENKKTEYRKVILSYVI